jgi:catechol 2,3-dioxygenase-like lactoylglutathione lyase family enzyme
MPLIETVELNHVSYVVPDLEAAISFFTDYLGFELTGKAGPIQSDLDDSITEIYAMPERAVGQSATLRKGNAMIEFFEWKVYGTSVNPLRETSEPGCHIALTVPDVEQAIQQFETIKGIRILKTSPEGFVYCFTPYGFQIKLMAGKAGPVM